MNQVEQRNHRLYHPQGTSNMTTVKPNCVFIHEKNSVSHELMKSLICIMVKKYGDFKVTPTMTALINGVEKEVMRQTLIGEPSSFLTEAVPKHSCRRVDVVILKDNTFVEVETSHKVKKKNCLTVYI